MEPPAVHRAATAEDCPEASAVLTESQKRWLTVRKFLASHRFDLTTAAGHDYPEALRVAGTPLLATPAWTLEAPIRLDAIELEYRSRTRITGVTGTGDQAENVLPVRPDGTRYSSYSQALAELAAPGLFENRATYRLLDVALTTAPRLVLGPGRYFAGIDVGEACAHEYAAARLDDPGTSRLRDLVGNPCDPQRRPVNVAISTLTLRLDPAAGATFLLHRRDADAVGHAGGLYQVVPVGVFQPAAEEPWNVTNDFSLWHCMVREFAEELLGQTENHKTHEAPIDYATWPFAADMTDGLAVGQIRPYCLGMGVDPLTFATDILATVVIEAATFDRLFGRLVTENAEGSVLPAVPFQRDVIDRFVWQEPMQAAGAALLALAWDHRDQLLDRQ